MAKAPLNTENIEAEVKASVNAENSAINTFMDHQKQALTETRKALESLVPSAVRDHGSNAIREMLEGYRQLFNSALDEVQKTVEKAKVEKKD